MLKFLSSMLCTSRVHPFSLGNYLRTSLIIGNVMITRHVQLIYLGVYVRYTDLEWIPF
jgi:hypothetical protein